MERAPAHRRRPELARLSPKLPTPGGRNAGANAEGAEPRARSRSRLAAPAAWAAPAPSAPAGCHWIPACPPPGPGITWPGPPAAAPATGSRTKPEAARPRCLRQPPPSAPRRPSPVPERRDGRRLARPCGVGGGRGRVPVAPPELPGPPRASPWRRLRKELALPEGGSGGWQQKATTPVT